ncbi:unnamed protein product, partial [Vitis vinifera]
MALKKAYAEIILNTSKEAAARIMASERKALRFQQDLCCLKDEALRMLLRLRQMIDFQTTEAETTSLRQRSRIEELEAQLHEAEDIIADLRVELKETKGELQKMRNKEVQPLNGQLPKVDATSPENGTYNDRLNTTELIGFWTIWAVIQQDRLNLQVILIWIIIMLIILIWRPSS